MSESSAGSEWTERWRSLAKQFQELADQPPTLHASITAFENDSDLAEARNCSELEPIWKTIGPREVAKPPRSGPGKRPPLSIVRQAFRAMEPSLWMGARNPERLKAGLLGRGAEGGQPVLVSIWGKDNAKAQQFTNLADEAQAILDSELPDGVSELPLPPRTNGPDWQRWLLSLLVLGLRTSIQVHVSLDPYVCEEQVEQALALISGAAPRSRSWADWSQTDVGTAFGLGSPSSIVGVLHEDICLASKRAAEWLATRVSLTTQQQDALSPILKSKLPQFERIGRAWRVSFESRSVELGEQKGCLLIKEATNHPDRLLDWETLHRAYNGSPLPPVSHQRILDAETSMAEAQAQLERLQERRESAENEHDEVALARVQRLTEELEERLRSRGRRRNRRSSFTDERVDAIEAMKKGIKRTLQRIKDRSPQLHQHFESHLRVERSGIQYSVSEGPAEPTAEQATGSD